jgi:hypothetical protein
MNKFYFNIDSAIPGPKLTPMSHASWSFALSYAVPSHTEFDGHWFALTSENSARLLSPAIKKLGSFHFYTFANPEPSCWRSNQAAVEIPKQGQ